MPAIDQTTITVKILGADEDAGAPRLADFLSFGQTLSKCLRRVEEIVASAKSHIQYRIVDLHSGSASLTLEAIPPIEGCDCRAAVVKQFRETVSRLESGQAIDERFSFDDLRTFRELVAPLGRHSKGISIGTVELSLQFAANIDKILTTAIESEGFITGRLERVNLHNKREFVLYPSVSGTRVVCDFEETLFEDVRRGLKRNVRVSGTMSFHPERAFPERVRVKSLEILPDDSELPKLADLKGMSPEATGELSSVEFVRKIRDEEVA